MWTLVRRLRDSGVTIVLTTLYIAEAEEMADRIGVLLKGELILVEEKAELMRKLGKKQLILDLEDRLAELPPALENRNLSVGRQGSELGDTYDGQSERAGIDTLLTDLSRLGIGFRDLRTKES